METLSTESPRRAALTDALLEIVAGRGLDQVSVREVATEAGVSIGTVQHYFPTKEDMLAAAFTEVVDRIRMRMNAVTLGADVRRNLSLVLRELLPLDERRAREVRIQVAFAARAATAPDLAGIQRIVIDELHGALTGAFVAAGLATGRARLAAHVAIATVDGLALHAVSTSRSPSAPGNPWLTARRLRDALELLLDALVP